MARVKYVKTRRTRQIQAQEISLQSVRQRSQTMVSSQLTWPQGQRTVQSQLFQPQSPETTSISCSITSNPPNLEPLSTRESTVSTLSTSLDSTAGSDSHCKPFNPNRLTTSFKNADSFLAQKHFDGCHHSGLCISSACSCAGDQTTCRESCGCGPQCHRQFPACNHSGPCDNTCHCVKYRRECTWRCACRECDNKTSHLPVPKFMILDSSIQGAGKGLFAQEFIKKDSFLGFYQGDIRRSKGVVQRDRGDTGDHMFLFDISKGRYYLVMDWLS